MLVKSISSRDPLIKKEIFVLWFNAKYTLNSHTLQHKIFSSVLCRVSLCQQGKYSVSSRARHSAVNVSIRHWQWILGCLFQDPNFIEPHEFFGASGPCVQLAGVHWVFWCLSFTVSTVRSDSMSWPWVLIILSPVYWGITNNHRYSVHLEVLLMLWLTNFTKCNIMSYVTS